MPPSYLAYSSTQHFNITRSSCCSPNESRMSETSATPAAVLGTVSRRLDDRVLQALPKRHTLTRVLLSCGYFMSLCLSDLCLSVACLSVGTPSGSLNITRKYSIRFKSYSIELNKYYSVLHSHPILKRYNRMPSSLQGCGRKKEMLNASNVRGFKKNGYLHLSQLRYFN